jgi:hypothetical protein
MRTILIGIIAVAAVTSVSAVVQKSSHVALLPNGPMPAINVP